MENSVQLRDVVPEDLEAFLAYEHDPEAVRRSRFAPRERDAFMTHWETRVLGDPANFVQTVVVDGETAGSVVAWWEEDRRFIGYWLGRAYWGRGIGTRALTAFLEREPARPLYADPAAGNTGSVRLLEKCGFTATGAVRFGEDEHVVLVLGGGA
ncbi:GNAT family N-acetyltransferase [Streptomyces sp. st170]|uniref:GNAT family N-acetyltransferase n=1 Tax=Streptomyces sp. st170 TaxID=1828058 RepID=UPI0015CF5184|nr:GNAT family N-acetyltransferase [Streptomyces sp. st170]